jgi:hypothetical protein
LKSQEREVWDWFASAKTRNDYSDMAKLHLLRSAYRIDRETQPALYQLAERAAAALEYAKPITIYQAQQVASGLNAGIVWIPDEAHIVLQGPVATHLTEPELLAVFGHEFAHAVLWSMNDGEYHVVDRVLDALVHDAEAQPAHARTQQLFHLYSEVFCDRGSLIAGADLDVAVSALVKLNTGVTEVNGRSFLAQAAEVLDADAKPTEGAVHPEDVIRARCLEFWSNKALDTERQIVHMIEGRPSLSRLDLLKQVELAEASRELVARLLRPAWMRSESILAHARLFFDDGRLPDLDDDAAGASFDFKGAEKELADYVCYVLLDFVTSDPDLREAALAHALLVAQELSLDERFLEAARKELGLRKKQLESLPEKAAKIIAEVETAESRG